MRYPFWAVLALVAAPALAQDAGAPSCSEFLDQDIEAQKRILGELHERGDAEGETPPESVLAGEQAVTMMAALCADSPDSDIGALLGDLPAAED